MLSGDVLADNGNGADSDPDAVGPPALPVTEIDGSDVGVGKKVTLNADGFGYTLSKVSDTDTASVTVTIDVVSNVAPVKNLVDDLTITNIDCGHRCSGQQVIGGRLPNPHR